MNEVGMHNPTQQPPVPVPKDPHGYLRKDFLIEHLRKRREIVLERLRELQSYRVKAEGELDGINTAIDVVESLKTDSK